MIANIPVNALNKAAKKALPNSKSNLIGTLHRKSRHVFEKVSTLGGLGMIQAKVNES